MIEHKIIEGTENDPVIYGLKTTYFYLFFAMLVGGSFLFSFLFVVIGSKNFIFFGLFFIAMFFVYRKFKNKSKQSKYIESKKNVLMSNNKLPQIK